MTAAAPPTTARLLDPVAAARTRHHLDAQPEAPWLHTEAARRMADRLLIIKKPPRRVLDWSGRAGGSTPVLTGACQSAELTQVRGAGDAGADASVRPWWQRLMPGRATPRSLAEPAVPPASFDMVWSAMGLHWAIDPLAQLQAWRRALAPEGFVMFSTLGPGTLAELRWLYAQAGWGSPMAPLVDMHDLGDMMVEAGFADPVMDQETLTLTWATPEALLAELRSLGRNADPARLAGSRTPRWRRQLCEALQAMAGTDGRIALSIELVYGHAYNKPESGPRVTPNTAIALDDMKLMLRKPGARR